MATTASAEQVATNLAKEYDAVIKRYDAAGLAAFFTEDALLVSPLGIFHGRDAIRKAYEADFDAGSSAEFISPPSTVRANGNLILMAGEWTAKMGDQATRGYYSCTITHEGQITFGANSVSPPTPA